MHRAALHLHEHDIEEGINQPEGNMQQKILLKMAEMKKQSRRHG
jgi:hypothetical protein